LRSRALAERRDLFTLSGRSQGAKKSILNSGKLAMSLLQKFLSKSKNMISRGVDVLVIVPEKENGEVARKCVGGKQSGRH